MTRAAAVALLSLSLFDSARAQHASHRLPPIGLEVLERAPGKVTGIGAIHHEADSKSVEAQRLYDQGLSYLHSYVWIDAARSFRAALRVDPALALAHVGLSIALVELNRPPDARRAIDAARQLAVSSTPHVRQHVELRTLQMAAEDAPADTARLNAYRRALDAALVAFPEDGELLLLRGMAESSDPAERGQGSSLASVPYYQKALAHQGAATAAQHYLTHAYENAGRQKDALAAAAQYAKAATATPHARHMLGHSLRRLGQVREAIVEFEAADRLHREYAKREQMAPEFDWHFEHNLGLLGTSLQYLGQMKRAATLLKAAFDLRTGLLVQAVNKREWPMFLRSRERLDEAATAARALIANQDPVVQATGHIEAGFVALATNRYGDAGVASNAALKLLRTAPGGPLAANALLALQGEFHLRTAARDKGRATLLEATRRLRAAPGPDLWTQAIFSIEAMARAARAVGDWELAGQLAAELVAHDPNYAGGHYAAALVAERQGEANAARASFAKALQLWAGADPDLVELNDIRQRMKR